MPFFFEGLLGYRLQIRTQGFEWTREQNGNAITLVNMREWIVWPGLSSSLPCRSMLLTAALLLVTPCEALSRIGMRYYTRARWQCCGSLSLWQSWASRCWAMDEWLRG